MATRREAGPMAQERALVIRQDFGRAFPGIVEGLRRAQSVFDSIRSFEDIERVFLKGAGLSPNTYRSYLAAVRQFHEYTEGKHPLTVTPADIEAFYDAVSKRVDRNTAYLRVAGLKRFFAGVKAVVPLYTSPFELMGDGLLKKLNRTRKSTKTRKALSTEEIKALLAWLRDNDPEAHALVFFLVTSGLRASELCGLRWRALDLVDGVWTARFVGKGDKPAEQELFTPAVEAARRAFKKRFRREPGLADALFYTRPRFPGDKPHPLSYHALWERVRGIGEAARDGGIIKRDLVFSPHLLRRSYATALYKSGMKLKAIQEKTRHASLDVLLRHYVDDTEPASPYLARALG